MLILMGFWMFSYLNKFATVTFTKAFKLIPVLENHPLPPLGRFRGGLKRNSKNDPDIGLNENLPYAYIPPGQDISFTRTPSGRASAGISGIADEPEILPTNVGQSLDLQVPLSAPTRDEVSPEIQTQEFIPGGLVPTINPGPLTAAEAQIPADARVAREEIPPPAEEPVQRPAPRPAAPAPSQVNPPRPAAPAAPAIVPIQTETPRKRLPRSSVGSITNRIQENLDQ